MYADALIWLTCANATIWVGLGAYVAFLAARQKILAKRIQQMELWRSEE